ncbi:hypothetical protein [Streptomyces sp. NPDC003456]|uniref:hypothetical protein n=1 Tax=Streptomyces sp. NPDC003456 TaxID=3364683 RepID=UPI0036C259E6
MSASVCTIGSVFLSDPHRRLHHTDAAELRRRRLLVEVLRSNMRPQRCAPPPSRTADEAAEPAASAAPPQRPATTP